MSDTVFYNMWRTTSAENKAKLLAAMRDEAPAFAAKVGFRSMTVLEGDDDRVLVEGRWASREAFDAAVTSDESARLSRQALEAFGRPEPGVFRKIFASVRSSRRKTPIHQAYFGKRSDDESSMRTVSSTMSLRVVKASPCFWSTACSRRGRYGAA